jgi:hypothetical protein
VVILALVANLLGLGMPIGVFVVLLFGLVSLVCTNLLHVYSYLKVSDRSLPIRLLKGVVILVSLQLYWVLLWGAEHRALRQVYANDLHWEKTPHFGRNGTMNEQERTADGLSPDPSYTESHTDHRKVLIGFLVFLLGLSLTWGVPILSALLF